MLESFGEMRWTINVYRIWHASMARQLSARTHQRYARLIDEAKRGNITFILLFLFRRSHLLLLLRSFFLFFSISINFCNPLELDVIFFLSESALFECVPLVDAVAIWNCVDCRK